MWFCHVGPCFSHVAGGAEQHFRHGCCGAAQLHLSNDTDGCGVAGVRLLGHRPLPSGDQGGGD